MVKKCPEYRNVCMDKWPTVFSTMIPDAFGIHTEDNNEIEDAHDTAVMDLRSIKNNPPNHPRPSTMTETTGTPSMLNNAPSTVNEDRDPLVKV
jgi:hypothetical protein